MPIASVVPFRLRRSRETAGWVDAFAANWADQYSSDQYPMRPERILSELRKAVPEDGYIVTDVGWNKNGCGQQFPNSTFLRGVAGRPPPGSTSTLPAHRDLFPIPII